MANYQSDLGIVLRVVDFSETSQVVGLFTREHGVVGMIAKGVKRENKKGVVSGPLDLLTSGEVVLVPAKGSRGGGGGAGAGELGTLAAWDLIDHRTALRKDLKSLNAAMMCAEVTTLLLAPTEPHEELYEDLESALGLLAGGVDRGRVVLAYVKAALTAAGYGPALGACLVCGRRVGGEMVRFYALGGGVACLGCSPSGGGRGVDVAGGIVVALERLEAPRVLAARTGGRAADAGALRVALEMLLALVEAVTDREVRTRWLVESVLK